MLQRIPQLLWHLAARMSARRVARGWIAELDHLAHDWDASDRLWERIASWMDTDPVKHQEFLILFREYCLWKEAVPAADGGFPDAPATLRAWAALCRSLLGCRAPLPLTKHERQAPAQRRIDV